MQKTLSNKEISKTKKKIQNIYTYFSKRLAKLKKRQNRIVEKTTKEIEQKRIDAIRKSLKK